MRFLQLYNRKLNVLCSETSEICLYLGKLYGVLVVQNLFLLHTLFGGFVSDTVDLDTAPVVSAFIPLGQIVRTFFRKIPKTVCRMVNHTNWELCSLTISFDSQATIIPKLCSLTVFAVDNHKTSPVFIL